MSALKSENFSIKSYYKNRLKKLYLPLILVVFITIILANQISFINWINLKPETTSVVFGYNNFWQLGANLDYFTRHISSPFMHLWYISILMQFDLIFPLIFIFLKKINKKIRINISNILVFLIMIITTLVFFIMSKTQDVMTVYYNTFARSFSIIFGVFLAILHHKYNNNINKKFQTFNQQIFWIYTIILILLCIFVTEKSNNYAIYMILTTIISCRLIKYSTLETSTHNVNNSNNDKIIKFLAKISYEIYLVQYPVIYFMQSASINNPLLIIIITLILSYIINILLTRIKNNKLLDIIRNCILILIIISGSFILITQKDYTNEMKELENKLSQNSEIVNEKNKQYSNKEPDENPDKEQVEITVVLESQEDIESKIKEKINKLPVVGIGDSVLLGAIDELYKYFPNGYFDGKVSRTITHAKKILTDLKNEGKLSNTLILALANNGDYSNKLNKEFMEIIGDREVYWINAVGADDPEFNEKFKNFASNYSNIHIIEWDVESKGHPEYFYADKIHLKGDGIKAYAKTIYNTIYNNYLKNYKK